MKKGTTGALIALMVLAMSIGMVGTASAAPLPGQAYAGNAYGTFAYVGNTIQSGRSSPVGLPCAPPAGPGFHTTATAAGVNVAGLLQTGLVDTSLTTGPATGPPVVTSTADVHDANVLSGVISASELKAVSATWANTSGYHNNATGSAIRGLLVAGVPILVVPPPNTTINLPGVGKVVLNEQITRTTATSSTMTVNMVHVYVSASLPGHPAGTQIIVGHSTSGLTQNAADAPTLQGGAYSASAHIGSLVTATQEFPVSFCGSTNGKTVTNSAASTSIPGIESSGTAANTVNGTLGSPTSTVVSTATVQNLNLLSSLVTVDAIKAEANASITGGTVTLDETGSVFTNLVVNGQALPANPAPNTKIAIGGITVWLNRVIKTGTGITVRMIEISVSKANPQGLPIGSDIRVASASASAFPFPTG